ncbi:putative MFS family arabinose efflux permease [Nocardioides albertanoniae]|uniref:Putative MFS family arabinose efflux permease n=1 Tax=Nocardioides albertanoniae TaxID=1175486 RepID=A0A543A2E9_9ACTN|nr:MFS transporter [Nocardioides albertanoniae]TQL66762.1 putative MFS family arabinose efflux permease [Nocardioides albertanoniae]
MTSETEPPSTASGSASAELRTISHHARGFWSVAFLFAVTMAFASAPAPLYVFYVEEQGWGSFGITVVFATYGVGVAASLFLAGHLSDRFGRRRVVAPAVLLNVLAALIFLSTHELGWLLLARFASGLGVGMLTATATAHLAELHRSARPQASTTRAEVVATAANIGGLGLGPLIAGVLAEWAPRPLYTPYAVFAFLMVIGLLAVVAAPETVDTDQPAWTYRPQRVRVPADARAAYFAAGMASFVAFAMFGFFTSLVPSFLADELHLRSHAVAGAIGFSIFGAAALFQVATGSWPRRRSYAAGLVALAAGLILVIGALWSGTFSILVAGAVVTGAGSGMAFKAAVATVISVAPADARGEALAGLFLMGYLGITMPVVLLGILVQYVATDPAMLTFGALLLVLLGVAGRGVAAPRRTS